MNARSSPAVCAFCPPPRGGETPHSRRGGVPPPWPMRRARTAVWRPSSCTSHGLWARCPLSVKGALKEWWRPRRHSPMRGANPAAWRPSSCTSHGLWARCPLSLKGTLASKLAWPRSGEPAPSRSGGVLAAMAHVQSKDSRLAALSCSSHGLWARCPLSLKGTLASKLAAIFLPGSRSA